MPLRIHLKTCIFNENRCIIKDHPAHCRSIPFNPIPFGNRLASWKFDRWFKSAERVPIRRKNAGEGGEAR